jgi:hypothetical protein
MDPAYYNKRLNKKNIDNKLVLQKKITPTPIKLKTLVHRATKQVQKLPKLQTSTSEQQVH